MKITTKLMLAALLVAVPTMAWSCSDDDDDNRKESITVEQLPQASRTFIADYYPGVSVLRVTKETDHSGSEYDVNLANGHEIEFNAAGEWTDVDAPTGQTVPAGIAPKAIVEYVTANYPDQGINEISRDRKGYEVDLTSGLDLEFDTNGNFIRIDR